MSELYSDLSPARREIRLLILAPGQARDEIQATLSVQSLNYNLEYEALSYVWGDLDIKQSIKLHGTDFHVTLNLVAALRRMRLPNAARILWVDAICINQSDILERESQITFMGDIYAKASHVLIWLGEDEERTNFAFDLLEHMAQGHHLKLSACEWDLKRQNDGTNTFPCTNDLHSLENVFTRPWWFRTWTLQEITLARTATLLCGDSQILWSDLDSACLGTAKHRECCSLCPKCGDALSLFLRTMQYLFLQRKEVKVAERPPLLDILSWNRFRKAMDPRDKVYGILGIARPDQVELFKPDYGCAVEELYTKTIVDDIQRTGSLRSLIHAVGNQACGDLDLPSWVADWSSCSENYRLLPTRQIVNELFNASDGSEVRGMLKGSRALSVAGFMVDQVHLVGEVANTSNLISIYSSIFHWRLLAKVDDDVSRSYVGGGTIQNAFWRTIITDKISTATVEHEAREIQWIRATQEVQADYDSWLKRVLMSSISGITGKPPPPDDPSDLAMGLAVLRAIQERKFFTTQKGYIGIGPPGTQPGDYVYILLGGKIPFLLRKDLEKRCLDSIDSEMQQYHSLVGDCYVHGIMDGEKIGGVQTATAEVLLR